MPRNPNKKKCKATSKRSGQQCKRYAAIGSEVCHYHGASGGAPKGNRNALKHGVDERVVLERLTPYEHELFESVSAEPDLSWEMKVVRFKQLRLLLDDLEREMVVGTPAGAEKVKLRVDEIQKADALAKLADTARKIAKELGGGEAERFEQLLAALLAPPPGEEDEEH